MKRNKLIYSMLSIALFTTMSCSDDNALTENFDKDKEAISFAPVLEGAGVMTRADGTAHSTTVLQKNFVIGMYNAAYSTTGVSPVPLKQRSTITWSTSDSKNVYTSNPVLYWDNLSSTEHDVRIPEGQTNAGSVKIWAASVAGRTCDPAQYPGDGSTGNQSDTTKTFISDTGVMNWIIYTDQKTNTNGSEGNDLLVADYITGQKATKNPIKLCFHHAMTKITVNVIKGDGFVDDDFTNAKTTLLNQNTQSTVTLTKADGETDADMLTNSTPKDIQMHRLTTANSGAIASFDAIVAPETSLSAASGTETHFANLVVGTSPSINPYKVILTKAVLTAWNNKTETESLSLKHGTHYVLNVTVKKQGISFTATIKDWTDGGTGEADGTITFTADSKTQGPSMTTTNLEKAFTIYSAADTASYAKGSLFTWDATNTKYATESPMYWNNNADKRYFRTAIYSDADASTEKTATIAQDTDASSKVTNSKVSDLEAVAYESSKDLLWGSSGSTIYEPTTANVKLLFIHALSKITVKLVTTTGADKVDLTDTNYGVSKVEITGTYITGGVLNLHSGTIVNKATAPAALEMTVNGTPTATSYNCNSYLVLPQKFNQTAGSEPKILITMKDGTTYSKMLPSIHEAATTASPKGLGQTKGEARWKQGEEYEYTITLKKSEIKFAASLKDWTKATGSGIADMDW